MNYKMNVDIYDPNTPAGMFSGLRLYLFVKSCMTTMTMGMAVMCLSVEKAFQRLFLMFVMTSRLILTSLMFGLKIGLKLLEWKLWRLEHKKTSNIKTLLRSVIYG